VNGKGDEPLVSSNFSLMNNLKFFDRQQEKQFSYNHSWGIFFHSKP